MPSKNQEQRLVDILENIQLVETFLGGRDWLTFSSDLRTIYAVTRALEIISEASRRLPAELKGRYPHIPWQRIAAAGNIYRHEYDSILHDVIWTTATMDLPPLPEAVNDMLDRMRRG
jgi:uncharacterized protein with HEPN domain